MITWMQKHRKYLIVTVWISSIAFIAATMVGWGAYNFSSSTSNVAKVGNIKISIDDFNRQYQNTYEQYNKKYQDTLGQPLDEELAKKLGLENEVLQILINRALLENFAIDSGIRISNEDIAIELQSYDTFKENGQFNRAKYDEFLKQSRIKVSEFEDLIKKDLLIKKIIDIVPNLLTPLEREVFLLPSRLEDRVSIEIIDNVKINITDEDLKKYYDTHKDKYKQAKEFEVEVIETSIEDIEAPENMVLSYYEANKANYTKDGVLLSFDDVKKDVKKDYQKREAQKSALREYNDFLNNKISGKKIVISEDNTNSEIIEAIVSTNDGDIIKPIFDNDKFISIKVIKKYPQEIKSFDEVKNIIKVDYEKIVKQDMLKKEAEIKVNVFKGEDIGFISMGNTRKIKHLNEFEVQQLLSKMFTSESKSGFLLLSDKVVLYKITEQRIANKASNREVEILNNIKYNLMENAIIDFLNKKYKTINYMKKD